MLTFHVGTQAPYFIRIPSSSSAGLATPRLLVFRDRVERNLQKMKNYLEAVQPGSGFRHLCAHVKTNKSSLLTGWMVQAGMSYLKTTMRELDVALAAGAENIFVAYPLLGHEAEVLARRIKENPQVNFQVQVGSASHVQILARVAATEHVRWQYFLDIDVGMHRTGMPPEAAWPLYQEIARSPHFTFTGLHGYDGHVHHADFSKRKEEAGRAMAKLVELVEWFEKRGVQIPRVVAAGSPTFRLDLEILSRAVSAETLVQVSPGTWILWDSDYEQLSPGEFEIAALILAQVIEVGVTNRITLNLGHKRWAADRGKVQLFSEEDLQVVSFSEEHTVLEHSGRKQFQIGDYVLISPRHVCPTVNLYEDFCVIGPEGEIEIASAPVDGRNR